MSKTCSHADALGTSVAKKLYLLLGFLVLLFESTLALPAVVPTNWKGVFSARSGTALVQGSSYLSDFNTIPGAQAICGFFSIKWEPIRTLLPSVIEEFTGAEPMRVPVGSLGLRPCL